MRSLALVWCVALGATAGVAAADAAPPSPRRAMAVLEYRAGSSALPALADRFTALVARTTSLEVVGLVESRRRYAAIDGAVADCAGDAGCVAKLGTKLGVDEVLLIGVSELGDIIVTLQRIDAPRGKALTRIAEAVPRDAAPSDDALLALLHRVLPESDFRRFGTIRIDSDLRGARVVVAGQFRGTTPIEAIRVPAPATYEIVVEKSGYQRFRAGVAVPPEGEVRVRADLSRAAKGESWYQKWWVAPAAALVVTAGITMAVIADDPESVRVYGHLE